MSIVNVLVRNLKDFFSSYDVVINNEIARSYATPLMYEVKDKYKELQHSFLYNYALTYATRELNKKRLTFVKFCNDKTIKDLFSNEYIAELTNDEKIEIYNRYRNNFDLEHNKQPQFITYKEKLKRFIIEHDELLNQREFINVIRNWPELNKKRDQSELYLEYYQLYYDKPETRTDIQLTPDTNIIGYKSKNKQKWLQNNSFITNNNNEEITNYFPLKTNIKKYQSHKISSRNSFIIDLMFVKNICYLIAININTRYLIAEPMNVQIINDTSAATSFREVDNENENKIRITKTKKNITSFLRAIQKVRNQVQINHLYGDGERAFVSNQVKDYYKNNNIIWHDVPRMIITDYDTITKSEPYHTSLGIIDRVIRTIRDIAWNMRISNITPNIMKIIVDQYNNAPHITLSHYAGFSVSPYMVQNDAELEEYITREIMKENYNITQSSMLKIGDKVKVYNVSDPMIKRRTRIVPGSHIITDYKNGYYTVKDSNNRSQKVTRYRLDRL